MTEKESLAAETTADKETKKSKKEDFGINVEEMAKTGMHLGHRTTKLHPKMQEYVVGIRNTVHIIDLKKTELCLKKALKFIAELCGQGGKIIFVSTKPPLRNLVKEAATELNIPYVVERWLGGTFTNFKVISQRAKHYKTLREQKERGEFEKLSKKERIRKEKDLERMEKKFEGIKDLEELPGAVFIFDIRKDKLCLKEAKEKGVKVVAICDTNVDPTLPDYPIPANDDAISSVRYILEKVKEAINKSKSK